MERVLTENQKQWFTELLDDAIKEARGAADNEHLWALGSETTDAAALHEANCGENRSYALFLEEVKAKYLGAKSV